MPVTCPSCGTENAEGAKFCNECGTALAQPDQRRKERKFATAVFADLGSATLAEREDPEVVQAVVGRAGEDPRALLDRAREILLECDAVGFLFEVDDAMAGR